jgi:uncharacterized membrane protein
MADQQTTRSIIVKGSPSELYHLWADVESFPRFMNNVKSVTRTGDSMTHWVVEGPFGRDVEWDAETTRMEEGKRIAWNSKDGSDVKTSGQVVFTQMPHDETQVTVTLQVAPQGALSGAVAGFFGKPEEALEEDLRRFKAYAEARQPAGAARG